MLTFIIGVTPHYNSTCLQHITSGYETYSVDFLMPVRVP